MPKKRHTEEQIVSALRQGQVGEKVAEICRRLGSARGRTMSWPRSQQRIVITCVLAIKSPPGRSRFAILLPAFLKSSSVIR